MIRVLGELRRKELRSRTRANQFERQIDEFLASRVIRTQTRTKRVAWLLILKRFFRRIPYKMQY